MWKHFFNVNLFHNIFSDKFASNFFFSPYNFFLILFRNSITTIDKFEHFASTNPYIESWGWITHPLNTLSKVTGIESSNVGHVFSAPINIYGVSPSLFNATIDGKKVNGQKITVNLGFLEIQNFDSSTNYLGLLQSLYTINGNKFWREK